MLLANPAAVLAAWMALGLLAAAISGAALMRFLRKRMLKPLSAAEAPRAGSASFELAAFHGVIADLKEQQEQSRKLREAESQRAATSEHISAAVLANLSSGVVIFRRNGLVWKMNAAARQILGYASAQGLRASELFRAAAGLRVDSNELAPESLAAAIQRTLSSGREFKRLEVDYLTPVGEQRVLGVTISPVRGTTPDDAVTAAACLISDLTEITALARQARLKENLAVMGEMATGIAHEFKNSLATISGYGQMLSSESDLRLTREFAAKITAETVELSRIVTDFLNFARPKALNRQPLRLSELLRAAASGTGVDLDCSQVPAACTIVADETALKQSFANLFRNSAQAARNGRPVHVKVAARSSGHQVIITVCDNGVGIPRDSLSKVFIPFFTTKSDGTGLGLALVHRVVTEHGGSISVASNDQGTTFTLSIPARNAVTSACARG